MSTLDAYIVGGIPPATREVLQRVAVLGTTFDTDEFVTLSTLPEGEAFDHLDRALAAAVVEPTDHGYRFRHGLVRDALFADVPPHRRRLIHRNAAQRLIELDASPAFAAVTRDGVRLLLSGDGSSGKKPLPDGRPQEPGGSNRIHIEVPDLEAEVDRLRAANVVFRTPEIVTGPGGSQVILEDPSGNPIEVFESRH